MRTRATLTTKLLAMGLGFLLFTLTSIGVTLWVTWKLEGGAAAVNEAGRLRMNTMRMALAVESGPRGELLQRIEKMDASLQLLETGDPAHPLFVPWSADTRARFAQVRAQWAEVRAQWLLPEAAPGPELLARADALTAVMNAFVDAIEVQIARWTAALHVLQLFLMGVAVFVAFGAVVMLYLVVLNPVARMQQALERVRQGELGTRLPVDSDDEFGQLAAGFNLMVHALQTSHTDLERKVREKTASVEIKNQRLAALYEVSAQAAQAGSLQALASGFVRQVRQVAGADAAAIRWSDEGNERYVMLAADGMPETMAQEEHCLNAGNCLCGQSYGQARMRVIPIVPDMQMELPHCHEAGYRLVVAIPIAQHQRVLGELNLFFRSDAGVSEEMRELLDAMVRHLASSMEGLRAAALEREAAVSDERSLIAQPLRNGGHPKGVHSMNVLLSSGTGRVIMAGNILAGAEQRNPRINTGNRVSFVNNFIAGTGAYTGQFDTSLKTRQKGLIDMIGNLYLPSSATSCKNKAIQFDEQFLTTAPQTQVYLADNQIDETYKADCLELTNADEALLADAPLTAFKGWETLPAESLKDVLIESAGSHPVSRNPLDQAVIGQILDGTIAPLENDKTAKNLLKKIKPKESVAWEKGAGPVIFFKDIGGMKQSLCARFKAVGGAGACPYL